MRKITCQHNTFLKEFKQKKYIACPSGVALVIISKIVINLANLALFFRAAGGGFVTFSWQNLNGQLLVSGLF